MNSLIEETSYFLFFNLKEELEAYQKSKTMMGKNCTCKRNIHRNLLYNIGANVPLFLDFQTDSDKKQYLLKLKNKAIC